MPGALSTIGEAERTARALENRAYVRWLLCHGESDSVEWLAREAPEALAWFRAAAADHRLRAAV
jgi:hypothetical protein